MKIVRQYNNQEQLHFTIENMEKVCTKWNGFDESVMDHFRMLFEEKTLFDVTLAADDGQLIEAHRIILSAGSLFFRDVFQKSNQTNMLIYLKDINRTHLDCITDFIYNGKAFILQDDLEEFLEVGKKLQIVGLLDEGNNEVLGMTSDEKNNAEEEETGKMFIEDEYEQEISLSAPEDTSVIVEEAASKEDDRSCTSIDLDLQVEAMIEKAKGLYNWKCKVCGKMTKGRKQVMQNHAETHIGLPNVCQICSKTFHTRHLLQCHISNIHGEVFSCENCARTGMNRKTYREHRRCHL